MTSDEYWNGDPQLTVSYRRSHELYVEQENQKLWLQGMYNYEAYAIALENAFRKKGAKAKSYPIEPHRVTALTNEEKREQKEKIVDDFRSKLNMLAKHFQGGDNLDGRKS